MNVEIKKLPKSKVELKIEITPKELNEFQEKAILNLAKNLQIKGFRKGQVPKEIIRQKIDKSDLVKETTDLAIKETYTQAISKHNLEVLDSPEIELSNKPLSSLDNPLEFKAKVSVLPEIKLSDYKKAASEVKRNKVSVKENEIEESLKWLQKTRAKFSLKEGPAQKGDFVQIEYTISHSQNPPQKDAFILGKGSFIPGFEEKLEGMKSNEEKEFSLVFQKKDTNFKVKVISVQKMELPEINDAWVKTLGGFKDLTALKKSIEQGILKEKETKESQRVRQEILEKTAKDSEFEIPEVLIEKEKERMTDNFKKEIVQNTKLNFEDYLSQVNKTEKEIVELFLPQAKQRVKNLLILKEIAVKEKIEVSDKEIKEEIERILKHYSDIKTAKKQLDLDRLKEYAKETIEVEKTLAKLENFSEI